MFAPLRPRAPISHSLRQTLKGMAANLRSAWGRSTAPLLGQHRDTDGFERGAHERPDSSGGRPQTLPAPPKPMNNAARALPADSFTAGSSSLQRRTALRGGRERFESLSATTAALLEGPAVLRAGPRPGVTAITAQTLEAVSPLTQLALDAVAERKTTAPQGAEHVDVDLWAKFG